MIINHLGLIAGAGDLPNHLIEALKEKKTKTSVVCIEGQTPDSVANLYPSVPTCWVQLGQVGKVISFFKEQNVTHIVMIGSIKRPSWDELKLDARGLKVLAKATFKPKGDDAVLRLVINELEEEGFKVIGLQEILPNILGKKGCLTKVHPSKDHMKDIEQGWDVLEILSPLDIGQVVAVQQGLVLSIEAIEGTDAMIQRAGDLKKDGLAPVIIKRPKKNQEKRADLPTLGITTILNAYKEGMAGIAYEAKSTILVDQDEMIKIANEKGLFLLGK